MRKITLLLSVTVISLTAQAAESTDPAAARHLAGIGCGACHGMDGNSVSGKYPRLAGQVPDYIAKQIADFKSGARRNATMQGMVSRLSERDVSNLVAYFAAQKVSYSAAAVDAVLAGEGERIFKAGIEAAGVPACMGCHGPDGTGQAPMFPRLAGQHPEYIESQLKSFQSGARSNDNAMMRDIATKLSEQQIRAVASYVSGLR